MSIPQSYTSFLAPVTASKLHNDVRAISAHASNEVKHFETPYVVKLHRVALLADALPVFRFDHPNRDACIDNNRCVAVQGVMRCTTADSPSICRYIALRFERGPDTPGALLHGFAGYFDAELYKDVHLSIYPPTHTPNMFSWFPIYFPLRTPVHVPSVRGTAGRAGQAALRLACRVSLLRRSCGAAATTPRFGMSGAPPRRRCVSLRERAQRARR